MFLLFNILHFLVIINIWFKDQKKVKNGQKIRRSSKQKRKYSGKKKRHTRKVQIIENADTQEIIALNFANGASHDFDLYKKSKQKVHNQIKKKLTKDIWEFWHFIAIQKFLKNLLNFTL